MGNFNSNIYDSNIASNSKVLIEYDAMYTRNMSLLLNKNIAANSFDLNNLLKKNNMQQQAAVKAEKTVKNLDEFYKKESSLYLVPSLCKYREEAEIMYNEVLDKALRKLGHGYDPKLVLVSSLRLLCNKLLHHPTIAYKKLARINNPLL